MALATDSTQRPQPRQSAHGWSGGSFTPCCDTLGDTSWAALISNVGHVQAPSPPTDGCFAMGLGSETPGVPFQQPYYDMAPFDTLVPLWLSTTALDDAAPTTTSRPSPPSTGPATFPDSTASPLTQTIPEETTLEPSSPSAPGWTTHHELDQQHGEISQVSGPEREHSAGSTCDTVSTDATASSAAQSERSCTTAAAAAARTAARVGRRNKKRRVREKNRTAAAKYRSKTKGEVAELEETEQQLAQKNCILSAHVEYLRYEILALKTEILRHGACESRLIRGYIMERARQLGLD
ncbi:uncharacterized protein B0I36DRAFT_366345 [Microdochium trichocladiopsis]|uniref:BZIP domain-containing protein n=1 Tax=Microdochium trichocladiopsis TaxID=1682393 RepID=A0A9P8Y036_9PEZI|nr:uncharacterized protein B0I36DRAFT_366345 [Microdochium trichocladiopsis]KAH7024396.1 hypothetical protein B0I36DRAFT_366345 [Microdochium trichocladiopsis]